MSAVVELREVPTKGELLAATSGDPVLTGEADPDPAVPSLLLRRGSSWAAAFVRPQWLRGLGVMLHGEDDLVLALVADPAFARWQRRARAAGARGLSVPRALEGPLAALLVDVGGRWEWMWTRTAPPPSSAATGALVVDLGEADRGAVEDLLAAHNARTDGEPFARAGQRWVGVRDWAGLVATGCCEVEPSGSPILAGITVVPEARGRGLGRAVTAELTRGAVAEHGWCTLGMYSDNPVARDLYRSLGYAVAARWTSGAMATGRSPHSPQGAVP